MMSQRDMVQRSLDRDKQRDVTPLRAPGDRRQRHRSGEDEDACVYCGAVLVDDALLRMACPALLGQPLPTHARVGMGVPASRQGWRARLAYVEAKLSDADYALESGTGKSVRPDTARASLRDALAEVRSIIDGDDR